MFPYLSCFVLVLFGWFLFPYLVVRLHQHSMALYGTVWLSLALPGTVPHYLALCVWERLGAFGSVWELLGVSGSVWGEIVEILCVTDKVS